MLVTVIVIFGALAFVAGFGKGFLFFNGDGIGSEVCNGVCGVCAVINGFAASGYAVIAVDPYSESMSGFSILMTWLLSAFLGALLTVIAFLLGSILGMLLLGLFWLMRFLYRK